MARSRRPTISVSRKHNNSWGAVVSSVFVTVGANSKVLLGSLTLNNPNIDETVLRVIGQVAVITDSATFESQIGSVGLIVVSNQAVAAGAASIPGPSTDMEDDGWFCHALFAQDAKAGDINSTSYPFESKGRRVVQEGESIAIMAENIHASEGMTVAVQFRILSRVTGT